MYEGGTIRDECRVREEGMVLCTRGAGGHYQGRVQGEGRGYGIMYEGGIIRDECRVREGGYGIMYEGGTIGDQCRVREEGMVLCTKGALSGMSAG